MDREIKTSVTIKNGGFEQAILQAVNEDGLLSDKDKLRLVELESLPQNRVEINGQIRIK